MMAMACETMYFKEKLRSDPQYTHETMLDGGYLEDKIRYYNRDSDNLIRNGRGLTYWDYYGETYPNYTLAYLFGQYL